MENVKLTSRKRRTDTEMAPVNKKRRTEDEIEMMEVDTQTDEFTSTMNEVRELRRGLAETHFLIQEVRLEVQLMRCRNSESFRKIESNQDAVLNKLYRNNRRQSHHYDVPRAHKYQNIRELRRQHTPYTKNAQ